MRRSHVLGAALVGIVMVATLGACGTKKDATPTTTTSKTTTQVTVPVIKPGTKPTDVTLTAACAKAVAPVEAMIHTMKSGAILTKAQTVVLNKVLADAPKACSTAAEIKSGHVGNQYLQWQYKDLLPWMRMPVTAPRTTVPPTTAAKHGVTTTVKHTTTTLKAVPAAKTTTTK